MEVQDKHRRYFRIAGITVCVESDLDFDTVKFKPEFAAFAVEGPGDDNVTLRHDFDLADMKDEDLGTEVYRKAPWSISRKGNTWHYRSIWSPENEPGLHHVAVFDAHYTHATIRSPARCKGLLRQVGWHSLSLFPTDQIWLAPLLADRSAVLLHSAGVILNGQGLVFAGHSDAGKSTMVTMLKSAAGAANGHSPLKVEILCDDRNVVRRWREGWRVHGTWSHGDVTEVSAASAPLAAILFLQQDTRNEVVPMTDRKEIWKRLLSTLIKPMVTAEWWQKELDVLEQIVRDVPCFTIHFDKSGAIAENLLRL